MNKEIWFAWYPVLLYDGSKWVWLKKVYREPDTFSMYENAYMATNHSEWIYTEIDKKDIL